MEILGLWLARQKVWLACVFFPCLCEGASSQHAGRRNRKPQSSVVKGNSFCCHSHARLGWKCKGCSLCSSGNLSDCNVGKMLIENQLEQNYRKISSAAFRQSWNIRIDMWLITLASLNRTTNLQPQIISVMVGSWVHYSCIMFLSVMSNLPKPSKCSPPWFIISICR